MMVLSLLQDKDQKLASDIVASREVIWALWRTRRNLPPSMYERRRTHEQTNSDIRLLASFRRRAGGAGVRADEDALEKDLTSVIALHGQPCGEVVASWCRKKTTISHRARTAIATACAGTDEWWWINSSGGSGTR